ncbi:MAG TPA: hypothetical protein VFI53_05195 [Myxococcaceae bacterium]|nr:hypothetical protein [Myxococcaceae bacterium]
MSDKTWMSPEELEKCSRAYDVESEEFCSPIPTQNISNGEYQPKPQSEKQKEVEARIKEYADGAAKKLGVSRRDFLMSSGGMAASLMAMNDVYGKFFDVGKEELFEPAARHDHGLPSDTFVVDDQLHFVRGNTRTTLGAPALRAIAQGGETREGNFFSDAFGFPTNPFNPDGFRDEKNNEPYYPWNKRLAAEYLANPNKYVNEVNAFTAPYSGVQNLDAKGAGDAFHFLRFIKSIFLDSQVTVGLISNVTTFVAAQPGTNLPVTNVDEARLSEILTAAQTANARNFINDIAGSRRAMAHGLLYVGKANLEYIQYQVENHRPDAWKGYCITHAAQPGRSQLSTGPGKNTAPLDTSPNATMKLWRHDDEDVAYPTFELISKYYKKLKDEIPGLNNICVHKGLAHGMDDIPEYGHPADMPAVCRDFPDLNFITYHSCIKDTFFDYFAWQQVVAAERGDRGSTRVVQGKVVPDISWTTEYCDLTGRFRNSYAELGTTFAGSVINFPTLWAHLIGQLLMFKGEDNIVFGSDSLWYGTPQWQLEAFWRFQIPDRIREKWGYPQITNHAKRKILGLNLARLYGLDTNVRKYNAVPSNYASLVPTQLKTLLEFDNGPVDLTAENDNLSKIKARYLATGAQRSNMRYGWVRTKA